MTTVPQQADKASGRLVFDSQSGEDTWVAKRIARKIEACGAKPFPDEAELVAFTPPLDSQEIAGKDRFASGKLNTECRSGRPCRFLC